MKVHTGRFIVRRGFRNYIEITVTIVLTSHDDVREFPVEELKMKGKTKESSKWTLKMHRITLSYRTQNSNYHTFVCTSTHKSDQTYTCVLQVWRVLRRRSSKIISTQCCHMRSVKKFILQFTSKNSKLTLATPPFSQS